jgi:hypothetical protein
MTTAISGMPIEGNEVWLGIGYYTDEDDLDADVFMGTTEAELKEDMLAHRVDTKLSFVFRVALPDVAGLKAAMASTIATKNAVTL